MSDSEDPPPPLPASPPPPPMEDSDLTPPPPKRRTSEKILVLQKILRDNGGLGMYNSPGDAGGAPPPSATASLDATDSSWEPPKLSHITKSRPKRKVRPPSRNSSLVRDDSVAMETTGHISAVEEEESGPTFNEELDPPLPPMSAPPGPPPELPEEDTQLQDDELFLPKGSKPTTSTPIETTVKPPVQSSWSDIPKTRKPPETVESKNSTSSTTPVQTKAIVIGSFSDRLKKLRERRAIKAKSNSSLPASSSPLATSTSSQPEADSRKTSSSTKSSTNIYTSSTKNSIENSPKSQSKTEALISTSKQTNEQTSFESFDSKKAVDKEIESDEDELPPAPPPPIPDLPPPSEELESMTTNPPVQSYTSVTKKISIRTTQWKDDWTRKSEQLQLDSFKSDGLPLLGMDSVHRAAPLVKQNRPNILEMSDSSLSGSAPSLPDSLPPDLPEAPPPDLPEAPPPMLPEVLPPDLPEAAPPTLPETPPPKRSETPPILPETPPPEREQMYLEPVGSKQNSLNSTPIFRSLETSTSSLNNNHDYSLSVVKLRERRISPSSDNSSKRRSAFDALVTVEPSSEEKNEPKLSLEERRKLTIMASRFSSADTDVAQQVWNKQAPSSQGTPQTERSENESLATSNSRSSVLDHSTDSLKASQPNSRRDSPNARTKERKPSPVSKNLSRNLKKEDMQKSQQKTPSIDTEGSKLIRVISEGTPPSSPNVKYTRVAKENWSPTVKRSAKFFPDELSASASTGNILPTATNIKKKKKTASLKSIGSDSDSPKTGSSSPWSIFKKGSSKRTKAISPLAAATVANPPTESIPKSPTAISLSSNSSNEFEAKKKQTRTKFFSSDVSQTPSPFTKQQKKVEQQLSKVKEQGKMTQEYLRKNPVAFLRNMTPRGTPKLRPGSMILGTEIYKTDPSQWSPEQVCKWLELVGLGSYREVFREHKVTGKRLLQLDIQLFDELEIESPEIREIFLAKIYELSNPSSGQEELEDDFKLSVDEYTSEDWKKFEAAVNALKSNVLDDTIELEPSAIGQFIQTGYARSQSTPNFTEIDEFGSYINEEYDAQEDSEITPSRTAYSFDQAMESRLHARQESAYSSTSQHLEVFQASTPQRVTETDYCEEELTTEWVAGLPNIRRKRALTEPIPTININRVEPHRPVVETLPRHARMSTPDGTMIFDPKRRVVKKKSMSPRQLSINENQELNVSRTEQNRNSTTNQCLVKLFMDTVQDGALYKSFLISPTTTTHDLIAMALEKAYLDEEHTPSLYTIWDRDKDTSSRSSFSRQLRSEESPVIIQSQWEPDESRFFELRLKEGIQLHPTPKKRKMSSLDLGDFEAQIRSLIEEKSRLLQELNEFHLQLRDKQTLEQQLELVSQECATVKSRYKSEQLSHNRVLSEMQGRLQQLSFEKTKLEDQLTVKTAASGGGEVATSMLSDMQSKYSATMDSLKEQLVERARENEELKRINITLGQEVVELRHDSEELKKMTRLLGEHQQQLKSAEQQLAEKEDTIHSLRGQLEHSEMTAKKATALQQTLQAMELSSKQQASLSNRSLSELKEKVSRLNAELGKKDQQLTSLKRERERLVRERQAKDNVMASLESDLDSYRVVSNPESDESERVATLQHSLSVHEVGLASLKTEYDRQAIELHQAEEEVSKLRDTLAKKEEQLILVSSSQEHQSNSSLYSLLGHSTSHQLIIAEVQSEESSFSEASIKVSGMLNNCRISEVSKEAVNAGVHLEDRLLEVNGVSVSGLPQREINTLLKKHSAEGPLRVVVARSSEGGRAELQALIDHDSVDNELIDRFKKLNLSLSSQLETQTSEVDRLRQECERFKSEVLKYSSFKKNQDLDFAFLESRNVELKTQLEKSERSRVQLQERLNQRRHNEEATKEKMKTQEELMSLVDATERAASARIKRLEVEKHQLLATLREHLVTTVDLPGPLPTTADQLTSAPRDQLMAKITEREEELGRNRAYLDQLLSVVIEHEPQLLATVGEAQLLRDQEEDDDPDDWC